MLCFLCFIQRFWQSWVFFMPNTLQCTRLNNLYRYNSVWQHQEKERTLFFSHAFLFRSCTNLQACRKKCFKHNKWKKTGAVPHSKVDLECELCERLFEAYRAQFFFQKSINLFYFVSFSQGTIRDGLLSIRRRKLKFVREKKPPPVSALFVFCSSLKQTVLPLPHKNNLAGCSESISGES